MRNVPKWVRALAVLIVLVAGAFAGVTVVDDGGGEPTSTVTTPQLLTVPGGPAGVTTTLAPAPDVVAVDGPDADRKRDDALPLAPAAVDELQDAVTATDAAGDTHSELADPLRESGDGPVVLNEGPLAAQELEGCRTRFVINSSSRNGTTPRVIVWHQTVSADRAGGADQDGLTAMANRRSSGVSWHLLVGGIDGRCTYTVPLNLKAWTQANANPFSVGIEVQAIGSEPRYVSGPGKAKLLSVTRAIAKRYGIPLQRGRVENCRVVKAGIVEHHDLGVCGGGHVDVSSTQWQRNPHGPELPGWDIAPLIAELKSGGCNAKCARARDVRARDAATLAELKRRACAPADRTRSERCTTLHRRHRALLKAAKAEGIAL